MLSLHEPRLTHGRFGPEAVIVDGKGGIRLADWGRPDAATPEDDTRAWVELTWSPASASRLADGLDELQRIMDDPKIPPYDHGHRGDRGGAVVRVVLADAALTPRRRSRHAAI